MVEKGYFVYYGITYHGASHPDARNLPNGAIDFTGEDFGIGLTRKYLKRGCFITVYPNGVRDILTDDDNLENLEILLSENNLPFDKELRRQRYKLTENEEWEKDNFSDQLHGPPIKRGRY